MIIQCTLGVLIYIFVMLIIGQININSKEKSDFFIVSSIVYNSFMGYVLITIFKLSNIYFSNIPKGLLGKHVIPELEASFNWFWGAFIIMAYFSCLIPINIYMSSRACNKSSTYLKINFIAMFAGILIYCLAS